MGINVVSVPRYLRLKYHWELQVSGFTAGYFTTADRPKATFEEAVFNGAGSHRPEKLPGRVGFDDLSFTKGVAAVGADQAVYDWMQEQVDFVTGVGTPPNSFLRDATLNELNRQGNIVDKWILHGCWVKTYDGGDLDASSSDNVIETITLTYQYFTK